MHPVDLTLTHSPWFIPLCILLGIGYAWLLYRGAARTHGWGRPLLWTLALARATVVSLLAFLLLGPLVRAWVREVRRPVVVLAHDGSSSLMLAGDTAGLRSTYATELDALAAALGDRFDVRTFTYGREVVEGIDRGQQANRTDMAALLREVHDRFAGPDLGAVILDGDGIVNRGRDPRHEAARLGVPVHTIALGDTTVRPDLLVRAVEANRVAYLGNEFPLVVRIEAHHLQGRRTRLAVEQGGQVLLEREVVVSADPYHQQVPLLVKATATGMQRFRVVLRPVEGEHSDRNNSAEVVVQVLDDRQRILLLADAPHPDLGALARALSGSEAYTVTTATMDKAPADVAAFDLVVLHRIPNVRQDGRALIDRCRERNVPLLAILGTEVDAEAVNALGFGLRMEGAQRTALTDARPLFEPSFALFQVDPATAQAFERFPPLQVPFAQYQAGPGAVTCFRQRIGMVNTDQPLLLVQRPQTGPRAAVIVGEGLWRWRLADQQQNGGTDRFDAFFRKLAQLMANRSSADRFRVQHADVFDDQEPVELQAELYDAAFELVDDAEVELVLKDEQGLERPYTFSRSGRGHRLVINGAAPGRYTYTARTTYDGTPFTATGEFMVRPVQVESVRTVADHGLLADLAAGTGGRMVRPGGLGDLRDALLADQRLAPRSHAYASTTDLIALRWPFLVFLVLVTLEWALRRRSGTY